VDTDVNVREVGSTMEVDTRLTQFWSPSNSNGLNQKRVERERRKERVSISRQEK
jgi:uncharacterized protein YdaU (DUF1376 family)